MARAHLIELHEQRWCPPQVRDGATDFLRFFVATTNPYKIVAVPLLAAIRATGSQQVIDLCSGGGGPWPQLAERLSADDPRRILLTDLYPNKRAGTQAGGRLSYSRQPVDACAVPPELTGFRTLFAAFHHFRPPQAAAILRDAVQRGEGIAVFELGARRILTMLGVCLLPFAHIFTAPWQRPFRWSRLFWTYLVPAIPLVLWLDGLVSCLRTYSPAELEELIEQAGGDGYRWQIGEEKMGWLPLRLTYLIGVPKTAEPGTRKQAQAVPVSTSI